jgi:hypothetical protein
MQSRSVPSAPGGSGCSRGGLARRGSHRSSRPERMESLRRSMNAPTARAMGVLQKPFSQSEMEDLLALPPCRRRPGTGSCIPRARRWRDAASWWPP